MFDKARQFVASHRDASELVKEAEKFAVRLPMVGRISVPPPEQLAFFGVLGALAALGAIDWPVAAAIGVGQVVVARNFGDRKPVADEPRPTAPAALREAPAKKAPAKKTPAEKATAKRHPSKKAAAKKAAERPPAGKQPPAAPSRNYSGT